MSNDNRNNTLAAPLQALLNQAARTVPAHTGTVERFKKRFQNAGDTTVVLADVSSSMDERAGSRKKIDVLREAMRLAVPPTATVIAFASVPQPVPYGVEVPDPSGGTALHLALELAASYRPRRTLVVSDGRPDSEALALEAAEALPGRIDVIYCGPDDDAQAIAFMHKLARVGGGTVVVEDITKRARPGNNALTGHVRTMLALPEAKAGRKNS
jgi:hypothetical protein